MLTVKILIKQCREGDRTVKQAWPQQATAEEGEEQLGIPCSSVSLPLETFETG